MHYLTANIYTLQHTDDPRFDMVIPLVSLIYVSPYLKRMQTNICTYPGAQIHIWSVIVLSIEWLYILVVCTYWVCPNGSFYVKRN